MTSTTMKNDRYIDVMIDLETTGTGPDAAIAAIGAVVFDRSNGSLRDSYYDAIDISSAVKNGGIIDPETIKWWMRQSPEAQEAAFKGSSSIDSALHSFAIWLDKQSRIASSVFRAELRVWGNGADFDMVVLGQSYKRVGLPTPWKFWNVRCFRTLKAEHPEITMGRSGTHHNALDDAITQAKHVLRIYAEKVTPAQPLAQVETTDIQPDHNLRRLALILCALCGANFAALAVNLYKIIF